jgi:hypothetical protein
MLSANIGEADMKVTIKSFDVDMEVKNAGIEFEVSSPNGENHMGDLIVTKRNLIWCQGRTRRENGKAISWEKFIEWVNAE